MSMIPHFPDNRLTVGGDVVSRTRQPRFTPQKHFLVVISLTANRRTKQFIIIQSNLH
jgi:hypothetical protein